MLDINTSQLKYFRMKTTKIEILHPGTLHSYFKKDDKTIQCRNVVLLEEEPIELQIEGRINSSDIIFLRGLYGGETGFKKGGTGYVKVLNLKNVTFEFDNTSYFTTRSDFGVATHGTRPKTVTSYMFAALKGVEKIILPADIKKIERDAFYDCSARVVVIPDCTETLETNSFERSRIESINVNAVTIKNGSFENCNHLKNITFGKNVNHINGAFDFHRLLESIEFSPDNKNFRIVDGCVLNAKKTHLVLYVQQEDVVRLVIPKGIERICGAAFQGKQVLKDIVLPDSLQYIGSGAFCCTSIEEIHIPSNVTIISGQFLPRTLKSIYFHSPTPPDMKGKNMFLPQILAHDDFVIFIPKGCMKSYLEKFERYKNFVQEADYEPQDRTPKKEVKNRAFYKKLASEIREMYAIEIAHHYDVFPQGRFAGERFINVWKSNLYYIKWMIRIGAITNITDEVFDYLLFNYPMKRPAINNLKGLLTISQIKRARKAEEEKLLKEEYLKFIAEQEQYRLEQDDIEDANRQFEEMMNEYEAWGNID